MLIARTPLLQQNNDPGNWEVCNRNPPVWHVTEHNHYRNCITRVRDYG